MDYYPFGAEFCDGGTKSYVQNHKYNGKEFDHMHGLNTYDYGARQYNPVTARWDRMDPHSEDYKDVSPFVYCHNNPVMKIDPDGKDDYYTSDGKFLGTNNEKTDYIYISDNYKQLKNGSYAIKSRVSLPDAELSSEAYSKIIGNCLNMMGIDLSDFVDNKVQVAVWNVATDKDGKPDANGNVSTKDYTDNAQFEEGISLNSLALTADDHSKGALITVNIWKKGSEERSLISTRSNIQSLVGDHEYKGHFGNNWKHKQNVSDPTYHFQMNEPTWKKTTQTFKNYIISTINKNGWN